MNTPETNAESDNEKIAAGLTALVVKLFADLTKISERIRDTAHRADNDLLNLTLTFNNLDFLVEHLENTDFPRSSIAGIRKVVDEIKEKINLIYVSFHEQLQQATVSGQSGQVLSTIDSSHEYLEDDQLSHPWTQSVRDIYGGNTVNPERLKQVLSGDMQKLGGKMESVLLPAAKECKSSSDEITTEQIMLLSGIKQIEHEFKNALKNHYISPEDREYIQNLISTIHHDLTLILESLRKLYKTLPDDFIAIYSKISAFSHAMLGILNPPPKQNVPRISTSDRSLR